MVSNVETVDDLVQLFLLDRKTSVAKWWTKLPHEFWEFVSPHIVLTVDVEITPSIEEDLDVTLLEGQNLERVLLLFHILVLLIDDSNEDINEYKEGK